jgi:hypothetical protein
LKIFEELAQKIEEGSEGFLNDPIYFFDFINQITSLIQIPKIKKLCPSLN